MSDFDIFLAQLFVIMGSGWIVGMACVVIYEWMRE